MIEFFSRTLGSRARARRRQRADRGERGVALVEFAIALPILLLLLTLTFDAGLGFAAARTTSAAARSAARVGAGAGAERHADFLALDAVRAQYDGNRDSVSWVSIYLSSPNSDGTVPAGCGPGELGVAGLCNVYPGSALNGLQSTNFLNDDCLGDADVLWCPTTRAANPGAFLGVAVWSSHEPTIGLVRAADFELEDRAVFAIYLPPPTSP